MLSLLLVAGYTAPVLADTEPVLDIGANGTWDDTRVDRACIIKDGGLYKMWYSGHNGTYRIGYATSSDGINWEKYAGNPVLDLGDTDDWDDAQVFRPWVIKDANPTTAGHEYKMYYSGNDGSTWRLGYANSSDGINWTKSGSNPILDTGPGGDFDDSGVYQACIIKNETDGYEMWYSGFDGAINRIGYATSPTGEHADWTKQGGSETDFSVLDVGSSGAWDEQGVYAPCVITDGSTYKMWYTGVGGGPDTIGYANSSNGMDWTKHNGDGGPVLTESSAGNFDENGVLAPCVINDGGTYKMWYTGQDSSSTNRIGYAISDDGIDWTRVSIPEFQIGSLGFLTILMLTMGVAVPFITVLAKRRKRK